MKRFTNPFHFAEPLHGSFHKRYLVGRERELETLNHSWKLGNFQTVVVRGQRLIGKTSLILVAGPEADSTVQKAWLKLGHIQRFDAPVKQFLYALCSSVERATGTPLVSFENPDWDHDPYRVCQEHLHDACRSLQRQALLVIVDDFDILEGLFGDNRGLDECLRFIAHLHQYIEQLGFVFITRFLPERFRNRETNPFANASRDIECSYLGRELPPTTRHEIMGRFLNNRLREHGPRFHDEAVDAILTLTNGHPYLAALLAHFVLQRFFDRLEDGNPDPLFYEDDIEAILEQEQVRRYITRYCRDIRADLYQSLGAADAAKALTILECIAQTESGVALRTLEHDIMNVAIRDTAELRSLIGKLRNHDIIEESQVAGEVGYRICVELFRGWVITQRATHESTPR